MEVYIKKKKEMNRQMLQGTPGSLDRGELLESWMREGVKESRCDTPPAVFCWHSLELEQVIPWPLVCETFQTTNGSFCLSSRMARIYPSWGFYCPSAMSTYCYHGNTPCFQAQYPYFQVGMLILLAQIAAQLSPVHILNVWIRSKSKLVPYALVCCIFCLFV